MRAKLVGGNDAVMVGFALLSCIPHGSLDFLHELTLE